MGRKIFTTVLFAVMVFIVGVTAASAELVTLPSAKFISNAFSGFLPIVMSSGSTETASPAGVLYVFSTTAKTSGNSGGRVGIGKKCAAEDPEAHFCEIGEVHNALTTTGVVFNTSLTHYQIKFVLRLGLWYEQQTQMKSSFQQERSRWAASRTSTMGSHVKQTNCRCIRSTWMPNTSTNTKSQIQNPCAYLSAGTTLLGVQTNTMDFAAPARPESGVLLYRTMGWKNG